MILQWFFSQNRSSFSLSLFLYLPLLYIFLPLQLSFNVALGRFRLFIVFVHRKSALFLNVVHNCFATYLPMVLLLYLLSLWLF